jgi:hypothetical protein
MFSVKGVGLGFIRVWIQGSGLRIGDPGSRVKGLGFMI